MRPIDLCYAWHHSAERVTITGADNGVDPKDLVSLSQKYPFVEWGILYSHDNPRDRYPSKEWITEATNLFNSAGVHFALHLCGKAQKDYASGDSYTLDLVEGLTNAWGLLSPTQCRIQLNGYDFKKPLKSVRNPFTPHILPVTLKNINVVGKPYKTPVEVQFLLDQSGGKGIELDLQSAENEILDRLMDVTAIYPLGIAGGIGEHNAQLALDMVGKLECRFGFQVGWIDMESSVRTPDNKFDLARVETVLKSIF